MKLKMPLKKRRKFGHKSRKHAYCSGFHDDHGSWNNGFICPKWGGPDQEYCCGTESDRYCCPEPTTPVPISYVDEHTPMVIGLLISGMVFVTLTAFLVCYLCHSCPMHRTCRKRCQKGRCRHRGQNVSYLNRHFDFVVGGSHSAQDPYYHDYSGLVLANGSTQVMQHPGFPPPSYPSDEMFEEACMIESEKQPLTPVNDQDEADVLSESDIRVAMWLHHAGMLPEHQAEEEPFVIYENSAGDPFLTPVTSLDRRRMAGDEERDISPTFDRRCYKQLLHHYTADSHNSSSLLSPSLSIKTM